MQERPLPLDIEDLVARRECLLVACNRDMTFPGPDGALHLGCGEVAARVEAQCGRRCDAVVGKPEPYMLELAARGRVRPSEFLVVGDSWSSDVAMARRCGCSWVYVPAPGQPAGEIPEGFAGDASGRVARSISELRRMFSSRAQS